MLGLLLWLCSGLHHHASSAGCAARHAPTGPNNQWVCAPLLRGLLTREWTAHCTYQVHGHVELLTIQGRVPSLVGQVPNLGQGERKDCDAVT